MSNTRTINIVMVDDDPLFLEHVSNLMSLQPEMVVHRCDHVEGLRRSLQREEFDCVVMDYDLGVENGLSVAETLRAKLPHAPPMIMITGSGDERTAVKAFRTGFSDYVSKRNFNIGELTTAIRRVVDQRKRELLVSANVFQSGPADETDPQTGLFAMGFMRERLVELANSRQGRGFTALAIGIQDLAAIRENVGYLTAERVCHAFATQFRAASRGSDICGTFGKDRWLLILESGLSRDKTEAAQIRFTEALTLQLNFDRLNVSVRPQITPVNYPSGEFTPLELVESAFAEVGALAASHGAETAEPATGENAECGPAGAPVSVLEERRLERRQRVLRRAKITFDDRNMTLVCDVRDMSPGGSKLRLDTWVAFPATFEIAILGTGITRRARTRWQRGVSVGIQFTGVEP